MDPLPPWPALPKTSPLDPEVIRIVATSLVADEAQVQALAALLDAHEIVRAQRFNQEIHRRRFLVAHGVLRLVLAGALGRKPEELRFNLGLYGKPALANEPHLRFNLSHSGDRALIALAWDRDLGVDLEQYNSRTDILGLAQRFFAADESAVLVGLPESLQKEAFFSCWSRKEAVIKALGTGLTTPLDSFAVEVDPRRPAALLRPPSAGGDLTLTALPLDDGWAGAIAAPGVWRAECWGFILNAALR